MSSPFTCKIGYIARITTSFIEIPNSICCAIYFSGCAFNCVGCQNKELQDIKYGKEMTVNEILQKIQENDLANWVCFLGGEPFYQPEFLYELCKNINRPIGIYTGNDYKMLTKKYKQIIDIKNVKFLKTGRFDMKLIMENEFPITSNQHVYIKKNNEWNMCTERTHNIIGGMICDLEKKF